jgi:hypothetical protein
MPRRSPSTSIDALVEQQLDDAVERAVRDIARSIAGMAAEELARRLEKGAVAPKRVAAVARPPRPRRRAPEQLTRWVADRRARRVPTFVIALTGLKTKKQIVARYGADAAFEKGKPAPRSRG